MSSFFDRLKKLRIEAKVVTTNRSATGTYFRILTHQSQKYYNCVASFQIPVLEGDSLVGVGVLESDERGGQRVRLLEMPIVQPDDSNENVRKLLHTMKKITWRVAEQLYEWLLNAAGPEQSLTAYLDKLATEYCQENQLAVIAPLEAAFPTLEIPKFMYWWNYHHSARRLRLLGLNPKEIKALYMAHDEAYRILLENPYLIISLPLERCEEVLKLTKRPLGPRERRAGEIARTLLLHVRERQWSCTPLSILKRECADLEQYLPSLITPLHRDDGEPRGYGCVVEYQCLYLSYQHRVETEVARRLLTLHEPLSDPKAAYFREDDRVPTAQQRAAVDHALTQRISIITGEAGSGKTTTAKWIVQNFELHKIPFVIVAFTGKAVSRAKEVTGRSNAYTIHRLLNKPLEEETVIPDETSMIETPLFYQFLKTQPEVKHLVFLGDPHQLLPIGWGSLFTELLRSQRLPLVHLDIQHRQATENALYLNLLRILDRQFVLPGENFELLEGGLGEVLRVVNDLHDANREFTVLSPVNRVIPDLNLKVRDIVNAYGRAVVEPRGVEWRVGDRVMMTENCYTLGVMNGEEGKVVDVYDDQLEVQFREGKFKIPFAVVTPTTTAEEDEVDGPEKEPPVTTKLLTLSWVMSVHKSQGSEWPCVIFYVPEGVRASGFFCNNLVYTGTSRAKEACWVIGGVSHYQEAITYKPSVRYEHLGERLQ